MRFSEREKAFEDKFAHDEELLFKVRARRNKQVGLWAAEKFGKSGDEAHHYADQLVVEMLDKDSLLARLRNDFQKNNLPVVDSDLFKSIDDYAIAARRHFMEGI